MTKATFELQDVTYDSVGIKIYHWLCTKGFTYYKGTPIMPGSVFSQPAFGFWGTWLLKETKCD